MAHHEVHFGILLAWLRKARLVQSGAASCGWLPAHLLLYFQQTNPGEHIRQLHSTETGQTVAVSFCLKLAAQVSAEWKTVMLNFRTFQHRLTVCQH